MEAPLEGNMLHSHEWSMKSTPPHFPLLSVLLRSLLVQAMYPLLKSMYHPSFIHSLLPHLSSKSRTVCCILLSRHKAIKFKTFQTSKVPQDPQEPSRLKNNTCCPCARYLDPSPIKGNLGCCTSTRKSRKDICCKSPF